MELSDIVFKIAINQDGEEVGQINVPGDKMLAIAVLGGLDSFDASPLIYYTCKDGPILFLSGSIQNKEMVCGLSLDPSDMQLGSVWKEVWELHKSKELMRANVFEAVNKFTEDTKALN